MKTKLDYIKNTLTGWANQMYTRFGFPVYLVGSALHSESPRDIDIRIVISDEQFEARYGNVLDWIDDGWSEVWREPRQKWARDMAKLSQDVTRITKQNVDFQVYSETYAQCFNGKERLRLDTIDNN